MKNITRFLLCLAGFAVAATHAAAQNGPSSPNAVAPSAGRAMDTQTGLTKFDLDFKGGTPQDLVQAIGQTRGKPLNAIIPPAFLNYPIPAFKIIGVDTKQLFDSLSVVGQQVFYVKGPNGPYSLPKTFAFLAASSPLNDETIWVFKADNLSGLPADYVCRFYLLTPYLDAGLTVDDITTAIQTGWKMLGSGEAPKISFHKETKLLIAVGDPQKVQMIDDALRALTTLKIARQAP